MKRKHYCNFKKAISALLIFIVFFSTFNLENYKTQAVISSNLSGDLDNDQNINLQDIILMKAYLCNKTTLSNLAVSNADIDGNSVVDVKDLLILRDFILGIRLELPKKISTMRNISTQQIVKEMGVGINLGNTMEATGSWVNAQVVKDYETCWGSPVITKSLIQGYASEGFGVLRIPVAWSNLMKDDGTYTINPELMSRITEIVDWSIESGLYVILNIHWDGGWWEKFPTEKEECMEKYTRIWEQISENFKNYSDYLMLESLNEEGGWESLWNMWSGNNNGKDVSFNLLNEINQKFVNIVRNSGGNNNERHLLIAGYNTSIDLTCDPLFKMPNDPQKRCAVSIHYYTPSPFAILEEDASWAKARTTWGTEADYAELNKYMTMMKTNFIDKGIPVIMGEYGVATKNKTPEMVRLYLSSVCNAAYSNEICPVLWDITDVFYDRTNYKMKDSLLLEQIMSVKE